MQVVDSGFAGSPWAVEKWFVTAFTPADFDHDGDVDLQDVEAFQACAAAPSVPHGGGSTCPGADFDDNGDVDQADFGAFQRCYSGADRPADPHCAS